MEGTESELLGLIRDRFVALDGRLDREEAAVADRFDKQDRTLAEIRVETKRTNGRVGGLEKWRGEQEAVTAKVEELTVNREKEDDEAERERRAKRQRTIEVLIGSVTILLAAILPLLLTGAI